MSKEFIPYQQALELKELGFDEPCFGYYEDNNLTITFPSTSSNGWKWVGNSIIPAKNTNAPLYQQAFRWFRETFNLQSLVGYYPNAKKWYSSYQDLKWSGKESLDYMKTEDRSTKFDTYEEAELACLRKLIQIVKENKQ